MRVPARPSKQDGPSGAPAAQRRGPRRPGAHDRHPLLAVQRTAGNAAATGLVRAAKAGPGRPLPEGLRTFYELRLGADLGGVRVHTDERAAGVPRALGAFAMTAGSHVLFAPGGYSPHTRAGRRLLAHELVHVAQTRPGTPPPRRVAHRRDHWERQADAAAGAVSRGAAFPVRPAAPPLIRLAADPRLAAYLERIRQLGRELSPVPFTDEHRVERLLEAMRGLDLSDPANLTPVAETVREAFQGEVLVGFLEQVEAVLQARRQAAAAEQQRLRRLMQVQRRGPYGTYGGVAAPVALEPIAQVVRPFLNAARSALAFFEGLLSGLRANLSADEVRRLGRKLATTSIGAVVLAPVLASGAAVGIVEDIYKAVRGVAEIVGNIRQVARGLLDLLTLLVSDEGPEVARALGAETGSRYAARIRSLLGHGTIRFTFELGRLVGPLVVYTVLSIVTAGAVGGAAVSARLAGILSRLPKASRLLDRLRGLVRRRRARATPDVDPGVSAAVERSFARTFDQPSPPAPTRAGGQPAAAGTTVAPELAAGFTLAQVRAFRRLLAKPLTHGDVSVLGRIWNRVSNPGEVAQLTAANSRRLFDNHRSRFWRAVRRDPQASALFTNAGCVFPRGPTTAPVWTGPGGRRIPMTVDHIVERQTRPGRALDPANLRIAFERENTVVLRLLNQLDPFQR